MSIGSLFTLIFNIKYTIYDKIIPTAIQNDCILIFLFFIVLSNLSLLFSRIFITV